MTSPSDETEPFAPDPEPVADTEQFPVARPTVTSDPEATATQPQHAVSADTPGINRGGWWAITIAAAVLLVIGFLLTFGPARYWTPVPVVFLGYFLISGAIGLVFWKGVRELRNPTPRLDTHQPASQGARVAAAVGAVGVASALILLPVGLSSAPAQALPCPDGSNTCGPQPTFDPGPTQGVNTTAPGAPQTTVPGYTAPNTPDAPTQGAPNDGSNIHVQTPDFGTPGPNDCIVNCGPTQAPQAPQTGRANPPQTAQQAPQSAQSPIATPNQTPANTAPPTSPAAQTPTSSPTNQPCTNPAAPPATSTGQDDTPGDGNSGIPYQAAMLAGIAGTYRRRSGSGGLPATDGSDSGPSPAPVTDTGTQEGRWSPVEEEFASQDVETTMAQLRGQPLLTQQGPYTPQQTADRDAAAQVAATNQAQAPLLDAVSQVNQPVPDPANMLQQGLDQQGQKQVTQGIAQPVTQALQPPMADPTTTVLNAAGNGTETPAGKETPEGVSLSPTPADAVNGGTAATAGAGTDILRDKWLTAIGDTPKGVDAKVAPWIKDIGEIKGLSRVGGVVGAVTMVPAIMSDIGDGNSVGKAVARETAGTAAGIGASIATGAAIGSIVPGAGTAVGAVAGAVVGAVAAWGTSKALDWLL